jgi:tetratricopeptide (TPR) repeat protein
MQTAFFDIVTFFSHPHQLLTEMGWMARDVYWTASQHVLTEFRVVSRYIFVILFPLPKMLVFDWWGFPVSESLIYPMTTLFSAILIVTLLTFSLWKIKRFPLLCFGILWYLIGISLESFFALGSDLYFEHRNYLPSSGLFIGVAGQMTIFLWSRMHRKHILLFIVIIGAVLGGLTFIRNSVWKDSLTLWSDTLSKAPSNIRAMMALGNVHLTLADFRDAEKYYREVVLISAKDQRLHFLDDAVYSLGMLFLYSGRVGEAGDLIGRYEMILESYRTEILKGFYKASRNDLDGAIREYQKVAGKAEGRDIIILETLIGDAYRKKGLLDDALQYYEKAVSEDPGFSAAYYGMGLTYMGKRDIHRASEYFEKTLLIDPNNVLALSDIADVILIRKGNPEEALRYAGRAVAKSSPFYQPYLTMGTVLIIFGKEHEAENFYKKAAERDAPGYLVPFSKARAYYLRGDTEKAQNQIAELRRFKDLPDHIKNILEGNR